MPLTYNIGYGLFAGWITWVVINGLSFCVELVKDPQGSIERKKAEVYTYLDNGKSGLPCYAFKKAKALNPIPHPHPHPHPHSHPHLRLPMPHSSPIDPRISRPITTGVGRRQCAYHRSLADSLRPPPPHTHTHPSPGPNTRWPPRMATPRRRRRRPRGRHPPGHHPGTTRAHHKEDAWASPCWQSLGCWAGRQVQPLHSASGRRSMLLHKCKAARGARRLYVKWRRPRARGIGRVGKRVWLLGSSDDSRLTARSWVNFVILRVFFCFSGFVCFFGRSEKRFFFSRCSCCSTHYSKAVGY